MNIIDRIPSRRSASAIPPIPHLPTTNYYYDISSIHFHDKEIRSGAVRNYDKAQVATFFLTRWDPHIFAGTSHRGSAAIWNNWNAYHQLTMIFYPNRLPMGTKNQPQGFERSARQYHPQHNGAASAPWKVLTHTHHCSKTTTIILYSYINVRCFTDFSFPSPNHIQSKMSKRFFLHPNFDKTKGVMQKGVGGV